MVADDTKLGRLRELVLELSKELEVLTGREGFPDGPPNQLASQALQTLGFSCSQHVEPSARIMRAARPPLPDPLLVRRIIRQRQLRARFFDGELFADPAWDMLLDLTAARAEHQRVSVTSLCIASGVPPTTALRWIGALVEGGLIKRSQDSMDGRRAWLSLTDNAAEMMARYFADAGAMRPL